MMWGAIFGSLLTLLLLLDWFARAAKGKEFDQEFWHRNHESFIVFGTILGALIGALLGYFALINGDDLPGQSNHTWTNDVEKKGLL